MSWNKTLINRHIKAARLLDKIKNQTLDFISKNREIKEEEVRAFVRKLYRQNNLTSDKQSPIVAFRENTSFVHYFGERPKKLKPNSLILLDFWARLNQAQSPQADLTWMAFSGKKVSGEVNRIFNLVIKARNKSLHELKKTILKKQMPSGFSLDEAARGVIRKAGHVEKFMHTTGHSLGFSSPHGREPGLNYKNHLPIEKNLGYTIEPGVYFKNKFGIRSEIDFYINLKNQLIVTTEIQKKISQI